MKDILQKARINACVGNSNEARAIALNQVGLKELFDRRQQLMSQMNADRIEAMEKAALPYLKELEEIDKQYSMLITMLGDNRKDD